MILEKKTENPIIRELQEVFLSLYYEDNNKRRAASSENFHEQFPAFYDKHFPKQHDAHEFLVLFFDSNY